jgi:hypothetical protein
VFTCRTPTPKSAGRRRKIGLPEEVICGWVGWRTTELVEVTVAVSVWANVGWIATSRDGIATGECISIVRDGPGLHWRRGVDKVDRHLAETAGCCLPSLEVDVVGRFHMLIIRQSGRMSR